MLPRVYMPHAKDCMSKTTYPRTPHSPYTLSTERYKANVNRTKTRKWVEAKKIDYGGDDWGGDDDFDDDDDDVDEAPPPIPQAQAQPSRPDRLAGLRAIGDGSGSSTPRSGSAGSARSLRPSERIAMERQGSGGPQQRNVTAPPALHVHTGAGVQQQRPVPPAVEHQESLSTATSPFPPRKSSMSQQDRPDLTINPAAKHPPRTSSRSASPSVRSPVAGSAAPRIIRPSEIYKRMEEEKDRERQSIDSARRSSLASSGDGEGPDNLANSARRPSVGKSEGGDGSRGLQALAPVAERKSEYGFDGLMINPGAPPPQQAQVSRDVVTETARDIEPRQDSEASLSSEPGLPKLQDPQTSTDRAPVQEPKKRYSLSPKLPDFTRMSGFGSDFFSSGVGFLGGSPKQPEASAEDIPMPAAGSIPTGVTRAAEPTHHQGEERTAAQTDDQSTALSNTQPPPEPSHPKPFRPSLPGGWVSETPSSTGEIATPFDNDSTTMNTRIPPIGEDPEDLALKPAPLRTPTPRDRETFSKSTDDERASSRSRGTSPVKPITPSPLANVEESGQGGNDATRTPEQDENTSEAQQASELTPVAVAPLQPRHSGPDSPTQELPRTILRSDTLMTDTSSPLKESDVLRDEIIRSLSPVRGSGSHLDAHGDEGAVRESAYLSDVYGDYWAGGDQKPEGEHAKDIEHTEPLSTVREGGSASATPTPPAASELESSKPGMRRERFSWEAASASPAPSPKKHPLPELPKDEPSPFEAPQVLSPLDSGPMSPLIALPVLNLDRNENENSDTPPSPIGDHEVSTSANRSTELFSPSTEKMTVESPTTPVGEGLTSLDPEPLETDSPTDIPLPRSPSPTKPAGDEMSPTSSSQNTMNLKQIMALPTSPERVYKLSEARAELASTPSGLPELLAQLLAQPEHANAAPSFKYAPAGDDLPLFANQRKAHHAAAAVMGGEGVSGAGGPGRRSSITLGSGIGGGGGSARIGSMSGATAAQLGNLMHGPAGAKGKELLQSAGKMGKGLLSKGKSKLRERTESKKG